MTYPEPPKLAAYSRARASFVSSSPTSSGLLVSHPFVGHPHGATDQSPSVPVDPVDVASLPASVTVVAVSPLLEPVALELDSVVSELRPEVSELEPGLELEPVVSELECVVDPVPSPCCPASCGSPVEPSVQPWKVDTIAARIAGREPLRIAYTIASQSTGVRVGPSPWS